MPGLNGFSCVIIDGCRAQIDIHIAPLDGRISIRWSNTRNSGCIHRVWIISSYKNSYVNSRGSTCGLPPSRLSVSPAVTTDASLRTVSASSQSISLPAHMHDTNFSLANATTLYIFGFLIPLKLFPYIGHGSYWFYEQALPNQRPLESQNIPVWYYAPGILTLHVFTWWHLVVLQQ